MEHLINIGYLILGALGLVVFLVIMWFAVGMTKAMIGIFFKRKEPNRNFISHEKLIDSLKNKAD
ncbi:hypothetical protein [Flavobacterium sp. ASV13]|uniref:hypothetical protein n=1 Tax=Flavobacterium sp. ASV13 TaxID=1506583 RepID=UPI00055540FE|nr:hypothetical protein [Flavobacterium sp. ASV13]